MLIDKWNAKDYANNSSAQEQWADELIGKLGLAGHESGLDIGCGDGRITAKLADILVNGSMVGIDLSRSMIELAMSNHASENAAFYQMSATDIALDKTFDFAFSNATLHWVKDHVAVLNGLHKHLNGGGRILFQMGGHGNAEAIRQAFEEVMERPKWRGQFQKFSFPYSFYDVDYYASILPRSGYKAERIELIEKTMKHDSPSDLKGWLRTTWFPYVECVDAVCQAEFIEEVLSCYLFTNPLDVQGKTSVKMVRLEVEAFAL